MPPSKKDDTAKPSTKSQIAGHFELEDVLAFKGAVAKAGIKHSRRITTQEAIYEALNDWCRKQGVTLPTAAKGHPKDE